MPIIKEYRYVLPMSVAEYIHSLDYVDIRSKMREFEESTNGEGVEFVGRRRDINIETGLPTEVYSQILHINQKLPAWMRAISTSLRDLKLKQTFFEEYTHDRCYSRTECEFVNDDWLNSKLKMESESRIIEGIGCDDDNMFNLNEDDLKKRKIQYVDISQENFNQELLDRVKVYQSADGKRGPLTKKWWLQNDIDFPVCCVCKLIKIECNVFGFASKVEKAILHEGYYKNNVTFHQRAWVSYNEWSILSDEQIQDYVDSNRSVLEQRRRSSEEERKEMTPDSPSVSRKSSKSAP